MILNDLVEALHRQIEEKTFYYRHSPSSDYPRGNAA